MIAPRVKYCKRLCAISAKPDHPGEEYNLSHALREPDLSKSDLGGEAENVVVSEY